MHESSLDLMKRSGRSRRLTLRFAQLKELLVATGALVAALCAASTAEAQSSNWSGFYLGGNIGGAWGSQRTDVQAADWLYDPLFPPFIASAGSSKSSPSNFTGGAQAGWNWQSQGFVWGLEGDIRALSLASHSDTGYIKDPYFQADSRFLEMTKIEWLATLRGRAGIPLGGALLYGTAGLAFGAVKSTYNYNVLYYGYDSHGAASTVATGWTAGAGVELPLSAKWTVGVQYLRFDLGSVNYQSKDKASFYHEKISASMLGDLVTATLNYRF
ncbi:outer membrane protein [Bradyrhizobium sp. Ec3.3]|nr:outer membrane beta-barrel protein [Bradyrhizobium sp. Ec3.3]